MENKKFELLCQGDSRILKINAQAGDNFTIEAGSMLSMTPTFNMNIVANSFGKMLGRALSGESALLQKYTARENGELILAPTYSGDIMAVEVGQNQYRISNGNFLACESSVELDVKARVKGIFGTGEGLFALNTSGQGALFVNACGSIYKKELQAGEEYIVDSGHLVLWDKNMTYSTELAGGSLGKSMLSGEGLVAKFVGPGEIWMQTRKPIVVTTE